MGTGKGESVDGVGGAKTVVDVDHGNSRGAGVQHPEKGGEAVEVRAITDGGGNGDQRGADQAAQHAGESGLHAGDHDQGVLRTEFIHPTECAVETGDPDVVKSFRSVS